MSLPQRRSSVIGSTPFSLSPRGSWLSQSICFSLPGPTPLSVQRLFHSSRIALEWNRTVINSPFWISMGRIKEAVQSGSTSSRSRLVGPRVQFPYSYYGFCARLARFLTDIFSSQGSFFCLLLVHFQDSRSPGCTRDIAIDTAALVSRPLPYRHPLKDSQTLQPWIKGTYLVPCDTDRADCPGGGGAVHCLAGELSAPSGVGLLSIGDIILA